MKTLLATIFLVSAVSAIDKKHPTIDRNFKASIAEQTPEFWFDKGQAILDEHLKKQLNKNVAKNVILFMGDGMSMPTIAASRIYQGQQSGFTGEEGHLFFEEFPITGLSRTYCVNAQVPDSACTGTAYLSGVKTNEGLLGVSAAVDRWNCGAMNDPVNKVDSIAKWAQDAGKATGLVTTTRVTHASPANVYAHIADRDWESDVEVKGNGSDPSVCSDIAKQLVFGPTGQKLNVIMGGGRENLLPIAEEGKREDGLNLIKMWEQQKASMGGTYKYIKEKLELEAITTPTDYFMGIFSKSHMNYRLEMEEDEPTLSQMVERAIKNLQTNPNGFFLFVEGGLIDRAHHENRAQRALEETVQFAEAIELATTLTSESDTLIVVTADHAHAMTFNGYPDRGNNILSIAGDGTDGLPYATLSYANGPSFIKPDSNGDRHDLSQDNMLDIKYEYPSMVPVESETHGGEDVAVFARGPWSHLFAGSFEQNFIPYGMAYASCLGAGRTVCKDQGIPRRS